MNLREKVLLLLFCVFFLLGTLSFVFYIQVIRPSFEEIERNDAIADMNRVLHSIKNELHHLKIFTSDWSAWDDTYEFIQSKSPAYVKTNLPISTFTVNGLNLVNFYDLNGNLVWGESHDLETEDLINFQEFSANSLPADHLLLTHDPDNKKISESSISGIRMTEHGPLMVASLPILTSDMEGPLRGTLIMGRLLDEPIVTRLNNQTKVNFSISSNIKLPSEDEQNVLQVFDLENPEKQIFIEYKDDRQLGISTTFPGLAGKPALVIHVERTRDVFARSQTVMDFTIYSIVISMVVSLIILAVALQRIVTGPVMALAGNAVEVGRSGNLTSTANINSSDEVGLLAKEFNTMMANLHEAKQKLQEQSFQMGMAELASGVLHNVRNILLQLSTNCEVISETIEHIPLSAIDRAEKELNLAEVDNARNVELIKFLTSTLKSLLVFISNTKDQLHQNKPLIGEIENILKSYEKWAYNSQIHEPVQLTGAIKDACQLMEKKLRDSMTMVIEPEVDEVSYLTANRIIFMQILMNIFTNAVEAIMRAGKEKGEIRIRAEVQDMGSVKAVQLSICDNGEGMDEDTLKYIFTRGFSTKDIENKGLGLHWCANAMQSMNGRIYAESDGIGLGTCLHLILPRDNIEQNETAPQ